MALVLQERPSRAGIRSGIGLFLDHWNPLAHALVAEPDRNQPHARLACLCRGLRGKALVILPVSDQHNVAEVAALLVEHIAEYLANAIADQRAATRDAVRRDIRQSHAEKPVVERQRALDHRRSGKYGQSHPIPLQLVNRVPDGQLGPFQAIWRKILRKHAARHIQQEDDIPAPLDDFLLHLVPSRACQRNHQASKGRQQQGSLEHASRGICQCGATGPRQQAGLNETPQSLLAPAGRIQHQRQQYGKQPQPVQHDHVAKTEVAHGFVLNHV